MSSEAPERIYAHMPEVELLSTEPCGCDHEASYVRADLATSISPVATRVRLAEAEAKLATQRNAALEEAARAVCSVCETVYSNPTHILCGPAIRSKDGFWQHWFIEGPNKGEFAGHCKANAIRSLIGTPV